MMNCPVCVHGSLGSRECTQSLWDRSCRVLASLTVAEGIPSGASWQSGGVEGGGRGVEVRSNLTYF